MVEATVEAVDAAGLTPRFSVERPLKPWTRRAGKEAAPLLEVSPPAAAEPVFVSFEACVSLDGRALRDVPVGVDKLIRCIRAGATLGGVGGTTKGGGQCNQ